MSLLEVLIASLILLIATTSMARFILAARQLHSTSMYDYTAINLARASLEVGETSYYSHTFLLTYQANAAGAYSGYAPWFVTLGNINDGRNMVPSGDPTSPDAKSVVITYDNEFNTQPGILMDPTNSADLNLGGFHQTVTVNWTEGGTKDANGVAHQRLLAVIPFNQANNQWHLKVNRFGWSPSGWSPSSEHVGVGGL